jgi:hypothetical protein
MLSILPQFTVPPLARWAESSCASFLHSVPVSPLLSRQVSSGDQHPDGPGNAWSALNKPFLFQIDYHLMDRRRTDAKMPLHFVFCRRNAMDLCVLIDERQVLSLLLGEPGFLLQPAILWAEHINHFPAIKDNDVFLGWVIAGFNQPLTLSFAHLLELAHCSFREVYLVAAITEKGREKYFLWHVRSVAEDWGIFNETSRAALCPHLFFQDFRAVSNWLA